MFALFLGLIAGIACTLHASVNSQIRYETKSPFIPTVINFVTAGTIMGIVLLITHGSIPFAEIADKPAWIWLGGACGTTIVITNILALPKLGSAKNVMITCFGQIMAGLIIDNFGLFENPMVGFDIKRLIGAVLVILGIALVNGIKIGRSSQVDNLNDAEKGEEKNKESRSILIYWGIALICGIASALQVAINGTLKVVTGSAITSTFISMSVGFITTLILIAIIVIRKGENGFFESDENRGKFKPWMCINGIIGISIVGGNALAAPVIGTGLVTVINIVGMMATGLIIDATGFLGIEKQPVTAAKIIGMILMIAGSAVISL